MAALSPSLLSDRDLLAETARVADRERRTTADLLALRAELDSRRLYLSAGYSSLFTYCTQALRFSEPAAYRRITAARAARRFPILFTLLADGDVTLTTVSLLAAHLTHDNHESLLGAARHKCKRDVEHLVACLYAQPDISTSVRRLSPVPAPLTSMPNPSPASVAADDGLRPPPAPPPTAARAVWARDRGRCAFIGSQGRCRETGFLEFHHVEPFAAGGPADTDNLQLRCRAHNQHEADRYFQHTGGDGDSRAAGSLTR
jgi:hypothetical protein